MRAAGRDHFTKADLLEKFQEIKSHVTSPYTSLNLDEKVKTQIAETLDMLIALCQSAKGNDIASVCSKDFFRMKKEMKDLLAPAHFFDLNDSVQYFQNRLNYVRAYRTTEQRYLAQNMHVKQDFEAFVCQLVSIARQVSSDPRAIIELSKFIGYMSVFFQNRSSFGDQGQRIFEDMPAQLSLLQDLCERYSDYEKLEDMISRIDWMLDWASFEKALAGQLKKAEGG